MEKGGPPHESAPPYLGPTMSDGGLTPHPVMYPQPSYSPGPPPPPPVYQEGPHPGMYSQPGFSPGAPSTGYAGGPYPGLYSQPGFSPGAPPAGYPGGPHPGMHPQPGFYPGAPPGGYPGGAGYPSVVQATPTTVVAQIMVPPSLQDVSERAVCQHCQQSVVTNIQHTPGWTTWLMCAVIAMMGGLGCCWIPFVINSCQDVEHRCPSCQKLIYIYRRNENYGYGRQRGYVARGYM